MTPKFKHDCDGCTFLGHYRDADLYFCPQGGNISTVIARYSDEPSDYQSGLQAGLNGLLPDLTEAVRLAKEKQLL